MNKFTRVPGLYLTTLSFMLLASCGDKANAQGLQPDPTTPNPHSNNPHYLNGKRDAERLLQSSPIDITCDNLHIVPPIALYPEGEENANPYARGYFDAYVKSFEQSRGAAIGNCLNTISGTSGVTAPGANAGSATVSSFETLLVKVKIMLNAFYNEGCNPSGISANATVGQPRCSYAQAETVAAQQGAESKYIAYAVASHVDIKALEEHRKTYATKVASNARQLNAGIAKDVSAILNASEVTEAQLAAAKVLLEKAQAVPRKRPILGSELF